MNDEDNEQLHSNKSLSTSSVNENLVHRNLPVPPGFEPLSNYQQMNRSSLDSQSIDEGIGRDAGSSSMFESAQSDYDFETVYFECREDNQTIVNEPKQMTTNNNSKLEWRNPSFNPRPRSHWNSNKVKYQTNNNQKQFNEKPRLKKTTNPNKAPLPPEKKKNSMLRHIQIFL